MSQPWSTLVAVGGGLLLLWAGLVLALWLLARRDQRTGSLREALRLLPDVVRLLRALAADPDLPRGVRLRLVLLLGYLLMPLDLVPDVIPVVGWPTTSWSSPSRCAPWCVVPGPAPSTATGPALPTGSPSYAAWPACRRLPRPDAGPAPALTPTAAPGSRL